MNHTPLRPTRVRAGLLATTTILALSGVSGTARAQAIPDLEPATVVSGLSVHHSFYDELETDLAAALSDRTAVFPGEEFVAHTLLYRGQFDSLEAWLGDNYEAAMQWLYDHANWLWQAIDFVVRVFGNGLCGGDEPGVELDVPIDSVYRMYTIAPGGFQASPLPAGEGQEIWIDLAELGLISEIEINAYLGDPNGSCTDRSTKDMKFVFKDLRYRGIVSFQPNGVIDVQVTPPALTALGPIFKELQSANDGSAVALFDIANQVIDGTNLAQKLTAYALQTVPDTLEEVLRAYWVPHLAHTGWRLDLSGSKQNARFAANGVNGTVGPALYERLDNDLAASKYRVRLTNAHGTIAASQQAVGADPAPFQPGAANVQPNWAAEGALAEGAFHTSFRNFEHVTTGAVRSAVGLRRESKPGSPHIVDWSFASLVPEATGAGQSTVNELFTNPLSVIGATLPVSAAQEAAIQAQVGSRILHDLALRVRVNEVRKRVVPDPLSTGPGAGTVEHDVLLEAVIGTATTDLLRETYEATFRGDLVLSKVPRGDAIEMRVIRAFLATDGLRTIRGQNGQAVSIPWDQVTGSTTFANAPVSVFLRAFFGDPAAPTSGSDRRPFFLLEGLTGPLVERSAHGQVVLPGLDFAAFDGPRLAYEAVAEGYYGGTYALGLDFDRDALCAAITRFGAANGLVNGSPSALDEMLVIEVDWQKVLPPDPNRIERTTTITSAVKSTIAAAATNPSRYDTGFLGVTYRPSNADESRVVDMSGHRVGAYLPNGGRHRAAATAAGYAALRLQYEANPSAFLDTTYELVPFKSLLPAENCGGQFPGPVYAPNEGSLGSHHDDAFLDVYEALLFESRQSCEGDGRCDGARVVALWTAPLFQCTKRFARDERTFDTQEGSLRVPPTRYVFDLEAGCEAGGTGGGGGHTQPGGLDH